MYCININIENFETRNITDIDDLRDNKVVIYLDGKTKGRLVDYYYSVYKLIKNNNNILLLILGDENIIYKQISMLMYTYSQYNIYKLPCTTKPESINKTYIDVLYEQEPSELDISMYIGSEIVSYEKGLPILLKLIDSVSRGDILELEKLIDAEKSSIESLIKILGYTKSVTEKVNMGEFNKLVERLKSDNSNFASKLRETEEELRKERYNREEAEAELRNKENELSQSLHRVASLERKLNQGNIIREYTTTNTKQFNCKVKVVLYFKEISHIKYINSFIHQYYEYLTRIQKKKVKLVIYDNPHFFLDTYKPLQPITSIDYVSKREDVVNKESKLLLTEANQSILQDILTSDVYDIVIIYDRLKQEEDIVSGSNVYKYYVFNSAKEINEIRKKKDIESEFIITNYGVSKDMLSLIEIDGYNQKTASPKLSAYMNMTNGGKDTRPIFDILNDRINVNKM